MKHEIFVEKAKGVGELVNNAGNNGFKVVKVKKLGRLYKFLNGIEKEINYLVVVKAVDKALFKKAVYVDRKLDLA